MNNFREYYLQPFTSKYQDRIRILDASKYRNYLIITLYLFISFLSTFSIFQNPFFMSEIIYENEQRILKESSVETQMIIENTNRIIQNPAYQLVTSFESTWVLVRNIFIYFLILFLLLSLMTEGWKFRKLFYETFLAHLNIISIGILVNTLLKHALLKTDFIIGVSIFSKSLFSNNVILTLLNRVDLFSLWFFYSLSYYLSKLYSEKLFVTLSLVLLLWICSSLFAYYLGFDFHFIF